TYVASQRERLDIGGPDHTAKSASLPVSSDPTRLSIWSCLAGLIVTNFSASSGLRPPYLTPLPASTFRRRASSSQPELNETETPGSAMIGPAAGIASCTSTLYAHQSLKHEPPPECLAISSATLYPSSTCWNVPILKPKSSATRQSISSSSWR